MGLTCIAIIGSVGFIALAASVIQANFFPLSLLVSKANCCRSASRTPWLICNGCLDNKPPIST
uniref:Uncharacterized protein n=1 Tax=Rhizophora mucronata TaxID=61149 RepID=A0A2P2Q7V9_RHIMU